MNGLGAVRTRIEAAANAAGRDPADVTLVAVSKEIGVDAIRAALAEGVTDLGENRAQDLVAKADTLGDLVTRWHFIGRLQRNKVRALAPHVALWQSVDRPELVHTIAGVAPGAAVLVQVNTGAEPQKGGCKPSETARLVADAQEAGLSVQGLMTVPPAAGDPRPHFAELRALTDELQLSVCSMGMSSDFEDAIREGSTMVRIGSAIFGPRPGAAGARR
jgi:pyridoxal phosphate enzyme (YggS family)